MAMVVLPQPESEGRISVEESLAKRETIRSFQPKNLTLSQLSQLLWATYGVRHAKEGKRTAASAGALYPLDVYTVVGDGGVESLDPGVYHYESSPHAVSLVNAGDLRREVANACLWQMWMAEAPIMLVITAEYRRATAKYGERGIRYVHIEAGHVGQNLFLQSVAMGLGAGIVGAFDDDEVAAVTKLPPGHEALLIMPVGYP